MGPRWTQLTAMGPWIAPGGIRIVRVPLTEARSPCLVPGRHRAALLAASYIGAGLIEC
jgi:hypothetical protein